MRVRPGRSVDTYRPRRACGGFRTRATSRSSANVCGAVGSAASSVASATGEFVMRGVTEWVTDAAVWVTGKVGDLVNSTTSPDLDGELVPR